MGCGAGFLLLCWLITQGVDLSSPLCSRCFSIFKRRECLIAASLASRFVWCELCTYI